MDARRKAAYEGRSIAPFILLMLSLLALVVSLIGLYRSSMITHARVADLQISWQALVEGDVQGSDLLVTDRMMRGIARPVPAVESAAGWSLAMAAMSVIFLTWLILSARSAERARERDNNNSERNAKAAMAKLLDEMAPLASGDLDVRATAHNGTSGALADTFNYAVGEMQRLTAAQLVTSRAITDTVKKSQLISGEIEQRCVEQSSHLHRSSNHLLGMSSTASELAAHTADTSHMINKVADDAGSGVNALHIGLRQLHDARTHTKASLKRLQSLSAHIRHIDETVVQLEEIAQRADVMALNSTLRASAAGKQNSSEHQLASIVNELSQELAALVEEISRNNAGVTMIMSNIRNDEAAAMELMQGVLSAYEHQLQQADLVDNILQRIQADIHALQQHVSIMSAQALQHAGVVTELSNNMDLINQITQETVDDMRNNADHLDELRKLANESRQNLSDLNMPDSSGYETPVTEEDGARQAADEAADREIIND